VLFAAVLLVTAGAVQAADEKPLMTGASASMLSNTCAGCHGTDGVSAGPSVPTIAGLSPDYFVELMKVYASDETYSTIMGRIAKGYTEGELKQMADFYAAKKFMPATQNSDAALVKTGAKLHDKYCEKCHSEGGTLPSDDSGILAGQWTPYLQWQLDDVLADKRDTGKKMRKKLDSLHEKEGDAGIKALLNYYASQK